jgi:hypothetical protein
VTVDVTNDGLFWVTNSVRLEPSPLVNRSHFIEGFGILSVTPSFCFLKGGSSVSIVTSRPISSKAVCTFGSFGSSYALSLGNSSISCVCPVGGPGLVYLNVVFEGQVSQFVEPLYFVKMPEIVSVIPSVVSSAGGDTVLLLGNHFLLDAEMFCCFGVLQTAGKFVSSNQFQCVTPVMANNIVQLRLGFSGMLSDSFLTMVVSQSLESLKLYPSIGFAAGGSVVTVQGDLFKSSSKAFCKFGNSVSPASVVNISSVTCVVPPCNSLGVVQFRILLDFVFDNAIFTSFMYVGQPMFSAMTPSCGSRSGGTLVYISLSNMSSGSNFRCRFGSVLQSAEIISTPVQHRNMKIMST